MTNRTQHLFQLCLNFGRRLLLKNGGPACLVGRRGSRFQGLFGNETCFGAVFTDPLAGKRVSVQSKRASCAPRPFYEGVWDLKKDVCQLFCCLNNRILRLIEPSGALVQKSLHRNPICCHRGLRNCTETRFAAIGGFETAPKPDLLPAQPVEDDEKAPDGPSWAGF